MLMMMWGKNGTGEGIIWSNLTGDGVENPLADPSGAGTPDISSSDSAAPSQSTSLESFLARSVRRHAAAI